MKQVAVTDMSTYYNANSFSAPSAITSTSTLTPSSAKSIYHRVDCTSGNITLTLAEGSLAVGQFIVVDADTPEAMGWVDNNLPPSPFKVVTGKGMHYYYNNPENFTTFATKRTNDTPIERLFKHTNLATSHNVKSM